MPTVVEHFEKYLGSIQHGWSKAADGHEMPFTVARYAAGSRPGSISFSTLGLGQHALTESGQAIYHELLFMAMEDFAERAIPSLLQQVGLLCLGNHRPLLKSEVIGPAGPIVDGSRLEALYVTGPAYFPDDFAVCVEGDRSVVVVWLVPITVAEVEFVRANGWDAFEDLLVEVDPNLMDLSRESIV